MIRANVILAALLFAPAHTIRCWRSRGLAEYGYAALRV